MKFSFLCLIGKAAVRSMLIFFGLSLTLSAAFAQNFDRIERARSKDILNAVKNEIKGKYYDPKFHGINLDEHFKKAENKLDQATSMNQAFGIIAQAVIDLNDSHTTFYPPARADHYEYGWRMKMIGDKCIVTAVKPKSNAEKQGLKIGDEILEIEKFKPTRSEFWKIMYYYYQLSPRKGLNIKVLSPGTKEPRILDIEAKVITGKGVVPIEDLFRQYTLREAKGVEHRFVTVGNTTVWQMPTFAIEPTDADVIMQGRVRRSSNLIMDLRGNGGGYVVTLEKIAGYFVEKDTTIAELKGRKEMKPQKAKSQGGDGFKGRLVVLVDSQSGSAAEIFARFVQLEKRGVVIGDISAGAVMQSKFSPMENGADSVVIPYGISITNADVIMSDGKSLEHTGVTPNLIMVPKGSDLAAQHDPVLAAAFQLLGENVTPEAAGKMFPYKWIEVDL